MAAPMTRRGPDAAGQRPAAGQPALQGHGAGREQEGEDAAGVVRLAAHDQEQQTKDDQAGDTDGPEPAGGPGSAASSPARKIQTGVSTSAGVDDLGDRGTWRGRARRSAGARRTRRTRASRSRPARPGRAAPSAAAIRPPRASHRLARGSPGAGVRADPTARAATRKPMFHLASEATADACPDGHPPAAARRLVSSLSTSTQRESPEEEVGHRRGQLVVMAPRNSAQVAAASAASTWPVRPALSIRLMVAVSRHHGRHHQGRG